MTDMGEIKLASSKILIIDDVKVNIEILDKVFIDNGFQTFYALDGQTGLELAGSEKPDLIILDIEMPGMDGFEVCRTLKNSDKTKDIPVIFVTASETLDDTLEGFKVGAADYINRPIRIQEVLARVNNQLILRHLRKQNAEEKETLELILDSLPMPYYISRIEDGEILRINHYACDRLQIDINQFKNFTAIDFYADPKDRESMLETVKKTGRFVNCEVEMKRLDGSCFTALYNATPIALGDENVFFVTFNDISKRKAMEEALERMANTDYLTGISNRRAFNELATIERARANRNHSVLSMMMMDIDHFKSINDTYGHDAGDQALKEMTAIISEHLRASDVFGRLGGEEFALLLPETHFEGSLTLAERLREKIEAHLVKTEKGEDFQMTISIGLAAWQEGKTLDDILKLTDERLYQAKQTGRNKVVSS